MAIVLVVDDRQTNRDFFAKLLAYRGHRVLEAADGAQALKMVKAEQPDLVISDILMPSMDGYEFVRLLRKDPNTSHIQVIFSTAHYLDREARKLAEDCGVEHTISKPAEPEAVLRIVDSVLGDQSAGKPPANNSQAATGFDRLHLRLLTDKLAENTNELRRVNERLTALIEVGQQLAAERDPLFLLESFCESARHIVGAKYSAVLVVDENQQVRHFFTSGIARELAANIGPVPAAVGLFGKLIRDGGVIRLAKIEESMYSSGFPAGYPRMKSFLGAAIGSSSGIFGALCVTDKLGFDEFSEEDERLIGLLVAQVGIAYENAKRFEELQNRAAELERTVSKLSRAEDELSVTQQRLRHALASSPAVIYKLRGDGSSATWVSDNVAWVLGYSPEQCLTPHWWIDRIHPDDHHRELQGLSELAARGHRISEYQFQHGNGKYRWIRDEQRLLETVTGEVEIVGAWVDISERKKDEEKVREANQALASLVQTSPLPILSLDLFGKIDSWNRASEAVFGWTAEEVIGRQNPLVPDERLEEYQQGLSAIRSGEAFTGLETMRLAKDGRHIDVSLSAAPRFDGTGQINGSVSIIEDRTDRKHLEEQFRQSQKMEAIGRLAGGVAHDFNNLLTAIIGYSQLALARIGQDDSIHKEIKEIEKAGQRAASLTTQLLAFSRRQVLQPQALSLNIIVADLTNMLKRLIGEDIDLETRLNSDIPRVQADRGQIEQIIMNLAVNSRDAMLDGGKLTLETALVELDEAYVSDYVDVRSGPYVMLAISDNGTGMDKQTQSRIFEPFFTTKTQGKGTGLGLSTVYGIVKQSGGHINVYSEPGEGTTFKVYLPCAEAAEVSKQSDPQNLEAVRGTETILLVEDEDAVRTLARMILVAQGYQVIEANGGEEAISFCHRHKGPIHLLLTDVVMPGSNGRELAQRVSSIIPDVKALYMSGYTDDSIVRHGVLDADTPFLQKPFTREMLLRKIREVLDGTYSGGAIKQSSMA